MTSGQGKYYGCHWFYEAQRKNKVVEREVEKERGSGVAGAYIRAGIKRTIE